MKPLNQFKESSDNLQAKIEIVEDAEDSIYKLYSKHNWRGRRHTKKYARLGHAAETTITTPFSNVVSQCAISWAWDVRLCCSACGIDGQLQQGLVIRSLVVATASTRSKFVVVHVVDLNELHITTQPHPVQWFVVCAGAILVIEVVCAVLDWAFAKKNGESPTGEFSGTLTTASQKVLQALANLTHHDALTFEPVDDLISLIFIVVNGKVSLVK